jgi:hypothetical protein
MTTRFNPIKGTCLYECLVYLFHACLNTLTAHECPHGTDEVYHADFDADILLCITVARLVIGLMETSVGVLRLR